MGKNFGEHFQGRGKFRDLHLKNRLEESRFIIKVMEFIKEITMTGVGNNS